MTGTAALAATIAQAAAAQDFAGIVSVSRGADVLTEQAFGLADRAHGIPVTPQTRFGIASGTKGFTALTVVSLVVDGLLELSTPARTLLGDDLPLIGPGVTVEHLLTHRSGIGDYVDEDTIDETSDDYLLRVPTHTLDRTEGYVPALDGLPPKFPAGTRFSYCNSGYVVLALLAERATGRPFADLVAERVWTPAGMSGAAFLRLDELPGDAAIGYLPDGRQNVLHLPVRGSGDGGAYASTADMRAFWAALFAGRIVPPDRVAQMVPRQQEPAAGPLRNAVGFWRLPEGPQVLLLGGDFGVSFESSHDPVTGWTYTIMANTFGASAPMGHLVQRLLDRP